MEEVEELTAEQKAINTSWFENVFHSIRDGGIWMGDAGRMRKDGNYFIANAITYMNVARLVDSDWMARRVLLIDTFVPNGEEQ